MDSLYQYILKNYFSSQSKLLTNSSDTNTSGYNVNGAVSTAVINVLSEHNTVTKNETIELSDELARLVSSDSFLKQLSDTIHKPSIGESEDDFIKRCNSSLRALLDKHLNSDINLSESSPKANRADSSH